MGVTSSPHYWRREMQVLRKMTMDHVLANANVADCPVVFTGTVEQCNDHARSLGCVWKDSRKMLFGGYWHKPASGDDLGYCLMPDAA